MMIDRFQVWIDARERYHLSHAQIQMARELGLNPRNFGKIANHKQENWKLPLAQFIEELYFKQFRRAKPEQMTSIEERVKEVRRKKEENKRRQRSSRESRIDPTPEDVNQ